MSRVHELVPVFVDEIPRELETGHLYISIVYGTVMHLCACGCGREVNTPLHPARWSLAWDGESVTIWPSVGSWGLPCRSHYVIQNNRVRWGRTWTPEKIQAGRRSDEHSVRQHFEQRASNDQAPKQPGRRRGVIGRLLRRR